MLVLKLILLNEVFNVTIHYSMVVKLGYVANNLINLHRTTADLDDLNKGPLAFTR